MSYSAKAIANYFLDIAESHQEQITPMKIQKLVYFSHGWHLAIYGAPLIDEQIEAWQFGPVINSLYHDFKKYGKLPITERAKDVDTQKIFSTSDISNAYIEPKVPADDSKTRMLLEKIWEIYGGFSAIQLSNLTHMTGSPWEQAWGLEGAPKGKDIDNEIIRKYFIEQAQAQQ